MGTYRTKLGDTWDMIAKDVYGDEIHADYLMENNPELLGIFVFSAGTVLSVPDLPEIVTSDLPAWRK